MRAGSSFVSPLSRPLFVASLVDEVSRVAPNQGWDRRARKTLSTTAQKQLEAMASTLSLLPWGAAAAAAAPAIFERIRENDFCGGQATTDIGVAVCAAKPAGVRLSDWVTSVELALLVEELEQRKQWSLLHTVLIGNRQVFDLLTHGVGRLGSGFNTRRPWRGSEL